MIFSLGYELKLYIEAELMVVELGQISELCPEKRTLQKWIHPTSTSWGLLKEQAFLDQLS